MVFLLFLVIIESRKFVVVLLTYLLLKDIYLLPFPLPLHVVIATYVVAYIQCC